MAEQNAGELLLEAALRLQDAAKEVHDAAQSGDRSRQESARQLHETLTKAREAAAMGVYQQTGAGRQMVAAQDWADSLLAAANRQVKRPAEQDAQNNQPQPTAKAEQPKGQEQTGAMTTAFRAARDSINYMNLAITQLVGAVGQASQVHAATLRGSDDLVRGAIGMFFLPAVMEASRGLQNMAHNIDNFRRTAIGQTVSHTIGAAAAAAFDSGSANRSAAMNFAMAPGVGAGLSATGYLGRAILGESGQRRLQERIEKPADENMPEWARRAMGWTASTLGLTPQKPVALSMQGMGQPSIGTAESYYDRLTMGSASIGGGASLEAQALQRQNEALSGIQGVLREIASNTQNIQPGFR